jgi:signal transduction histidine kinase
MKKEILLIDDEPHEYILFQKKFEILLRDDFNISYIQNLEDLKKEAKIYDLIFIDYHIGPNTGIDVLNYLKGKKDTSFKILLTGSIENESIVEGFRIGLDDYISKNNLNVPEMERLLRYYRQIKKEQQEKQELEQQVLHSQKLESLGIMAGGIAHDFNNLLTAMMGNACLGRLQKESSIKNEFFRKIDYSARRAAELCNLMLAYSGKGNFKINNININSLTKEISSLFRATISKKININYYLSEGELNIKGDSAQITQVIMNLVTNAADALQDKKGHISIKTGVRYCDEIYFSNSYASENMKNDHYAFIEVTDNGSGMDEETIKRMFDPFFTTKFTGRGLGLSAVLGIVKAHKGCINVYSELGHGTSIKVIFPVNKEVFKIKEKLALKVNKSLNDMTILIVDDEDDVLNAIHNGLEYYGCKVITAVNGKDALEKYKKFYDSIHIIITDLMMPEMNGAEFLTEIKKLDEKIPIIVMSGYSEEEVLSRYIRENKVDFVQKPFSIHHLLKLIKDHVIQN